MKYTLLMNKISGERAIRINATGEKIIELDSPARYAKLRKLAVANRRRNDKDDLMRSLGLTKAIGAVSGKTYWE